MPKMSPVVRCFPTRLFFVRLRQFRRRKRTGCQSGVTWPHSKNPYNFARVGQLRRRQQLRSLLSFFAYGMFKTNELYKEYFILPAEPFSSLCAETYAFRSTFRGTSEPQSKWRENYRMALTAYLAKDYQKAVELFEQVEPFSEFQGDLSEPWQREFFFHYALARLGKSGGKPVHRRECAEASRLFEKALTLQTKSKRRR